MLARALERRFAASRADADKTPEPDGFGPPGFDTSPPLDARARGFELKVGGGGGGGGEIGFDDAEDNGGGGGRTCPSKLELLLTAVRAGNMVLEGL